LILISIPVNFGEFNNAPIKYITQLSYNKTIFVEYDDTGTPVFYTYLIKTYHIEPIKVCPIGIDENLIKNMGFKADKDDYDVLISSQIIETNKSAIYFAPLKNSIPYNKATSKIYWKIDPLNYKISTVKPKYKLPKVGEVVAIYEDGSPACIKVGNKIYCGFEANKEVLYNLLYIFMIKKVPYGVLTVIGAILFSSAFALSLKYPKIKNALEDVGAFVICRITLTDKDKVLLNDTRREIYNYILNNPGCHFREISKNLNKSASTLNWHLRILEKSKLIGSRKFGNKIIYYPTGMDIRNLPLLSLKSKMSKQIYEYLLKNPAHLRKIASDLNANVETIRYNLKNMEKLGIVKRKEDGNKIIYYINPEIYSK